MSGRRWRTHTTDIDESVFRIVAVSTQGWLRRRPREMVGIIFHRKARCASTDLSRIGVHTAILGCSQCNFHSSVCSFFTRWLFLLPIQMVDACNLERGFRWKAYSQIYGSEGTCSKCQGGRGNGTEASAGRQNILRWTQVFPQVEQLQKYYAVRAYIDVELHASPVLSTFLHHMFFRFFRWAGSEYWLSGLETTPSSHDVDLVLGRLASDGRAYFAGKLGA